MHGTATQWQLNTSNPHPNSAWRIIWIYKKQKKTLAIDEEMQKLIHIES
jgi:hypothetical protein